MILLNNGFRGFSIHISKIFSEVQLVDNAILVNLRVVV
jgi:hypothetical protein